MADNVELDAGTGGAVIAADDISTVWYQIQKLAFGPLNTATLVTASVGLPVDIKASVALDVSAANVTVVGTGTLVVQEDGAALTALQLIDNPVQVLGTDTYAETVDSGMLVGVVRNDDLATLVNTDNEIAPLQVDQNGALYVTAGSVLSAGNSTTSTLNNAAVFTGAGVDCLGYGVVTIMLKASHDSATDGMTFQFSTDDTNWDDVFPFTYTAADGARRFQFPITGRFFRVVYTNGGVNQTSFRMQTILQVTNALTTIHRLKDVTSPDRSAQLMKTAIIAQAGGSGDFVSVQATANGNLKMSVQEFSDGVDVGNGAVGTETLRVTLANDSTGIVGLTGGALTALQLIDDPVAVLGTATYTETTTKGVVIGVVRNDALGALALTDNEIAPLQVNASGALYVQEGAAMDVSAATVTTTPAVTGGGVEATAQRVTIANDSTGVLSVDDAGGALTVDWNGTTPPIGAGTEAGALRVTLATDSTGVVSIDDGGGNISVDWAGTNPPIGAGTEAAALRVTLATDSTGVVSIDDNSGSLTVDFSARSAGGCKMFTSVDLDETEEDVTTAATTIYGIYAWNLTAVPLWLQLFNTNTVTVGTTAPTNNFMIPANADSDGAGVVIPVPVNGLAYTAALTVAITTGSGTNSGAPGAGDAGIVVMYQD